MAVRCPAAVRNARQIISPHPSSVRSAAPRSRVTRHRPLPVHLKLASTAPHIRVTPEQPDASTTLEGERKTVTALFADIKGSTELMEDLDPEEARAIIDPALKLMIDAVHRYDGYVVQSTGDGIFALFGAPVAHEDHPQRALYAALRMQEELKRYSAKLRADGGPPIAGARRRQHRRSGGALDPDRRGPDRVHADRAYDQSGVADADAGAGRLDRGQRSRRASCAKATSSCKPLGPTRVKGVSEPVNVYEVTGLGPLRTRLQRAARRGLTKFVGREREMERCGTPLESAHGRARTDRRGDGGGGHRQVAAVLRVQGEHRSRAGWCWRPSRSRTARRRRICRCSICCTAISTSRTTTMRARAARRSRATSLALDPALEDTLPYLFGLLGIVEGDDPLAQMDAQIKQAAHARGDQAHRAARDRSISR